MKNRQWILRRRPEGDIGPGDLELRESDVRPLAEGEALCRNVYLSLDPTNRIWMSGRDPSNADKPVRAKKTRQIGKLERRV